MGGPKLLKWGLSGRGSNLKSNLLKSDPPLTSTTPRWYGISLDLVLVLREVYFMELNGVGGVGGWSYHTKICYPRGVGLWGIERARSNLDTYFPRGYAYQSPNRYRSSPRYTRFTALRTCLLPHSPGLLRVCALDRIDGSPPV